MGDLTATGNVEIPAIYAGHGQVERRTRAAALLGRLGLGDRALHRPGQLSGGQQQRVAIARAMVNSPKIIFADEPTANLDSETSDQVMKTFLALNKEGQTIIMVTHEPDYALLADRTITLADGVLVSDVMNDR